MRDDPKSPLSAIRRRFAGETVARCPEAIPTGMKAGVFSSTIMHYAYILQSIENPDRFYVGYTSDLKNRLNDHNSGKSSHTKKYKLLVIPLNVANLRVFSVKKTATFGLENWSKDSCLKCE